MNNDDWWQQQNDWWNDETNEYLSSQLNSQFSPAADVNSADINSVDVNQTFNNYHQAFSNDFKLDWNGNPITQNTQNNQNNNQQNQQQRIAKSNKTFGNLIFAVTVIIVGIVGTIAFSNLDNLGFNLGPGLGITGLGSIGTPSMSLEDREARANEFLTTYGITVSESSANSAEMINQILPGLANIHEGLNPTEVVEILGMNPTEVSFSLRFASIPTRYQLSWNSVEFYDWRWNQATRLDVSFDVDGNIQEFRLRNPELRLPQVQQAASISLNVGAPLAETIPNFEIPPTGFERWFIVEDSEWRSPGSGRIEWWTNFEDYEGATWFAIDLDENGDVQRWGLSSTMRD